MRRRLPIATRNGKPAWEGAKPRLRQSEIDRQRAEEQQRESAS